MNEHNSPGKIRYLIIDHLRALAVVWMILFHFSYDLRIFSLPSIDPNAQWYWLGFPRLIVATFMLSMGMSLSAAQLHGKLSTRRFAQRFIKVSLAAILVSLGTYFTFPERWVYFGTLHCIAISSLLIWPLLKKPKTSLILGLLILGLDFFFELRIPWIQLSHPSMDYIPPFPWVSWSLFGIWLFHIGHNQHSAWSLQPQKALSFMGRHSLKIYLIHQPLLIGVIWLLWKSYAILT